MLLWAIEGGAATRYAVPSGGVSATTCTDISVPCTLTRAVSQLAVGDTLYLRGGNYTGYTVGSMVLPQGSAWTAGNFTTIASYQAEVVHFDAGPFQTFGGGTPAAYVKFDGTGSGRCEVVHQCGLVFDGINQGWSDAFSAGQGSGPFWLEGVEFKNYGSNGIHPGATSSGNHIFRHIYLHTGGCMVYDNAIYNDSSGSEFSYIEVTGWTGAAFQNYPTPSNTTVKNNWFHNTGGGYPGASIPGVGTCGDYLPQYQNDQRIDGIIESSSASNANNRYYNNVISNLNNPVGASWHGAIFYVQGQNAVFVSNTITGNVIGVNSEAGSSTGAMLRNNLIVENGTNQTGDAFQTSGENITSGSASTYFNNAAGNDYTLKATASLAIDQGFPLGSPYDTDYAGNARGAGSGWDIGAFEFIGTPIPPSLVLAMAFETGSGPVSNDISGRNNNGTLGNGVDWNYAGKYGKAVEFTGTGGITVPNANSLNLSLYTIEAWIYPTANPPTNTFAPVINKYDYPTGSGGYFLEYKSATGSCGVANASLAGHAEQVTNTNIWTCDVNANIPLNQWTHLAGTYDGTNISLYRDGQLVSTTIAPPMAAFAGTGSLVIGFSVFDEPFVGKIDEVRIYNYARTQAEIQSDMNTPLVTAPGTVAGITFSADKSITLCASCSLKVQAQ